MSEAKHALELLSLEPSAQRIAEMRRDAELMRRLDRAEDRAQGRAEGLAEGEARGEAKGEANGVRSSIVTACAAFGVTVTEERSRQLQTAALDELRALLETLLTRREWPGSPYQSTEE